MTVTAGRRSLDKWDPLTGFELIEHDGEARFRVRRELLEAGGAAVEQAVEGGFPDGTELEHVPGAGWLTVLPYDDSDAADPEPSRAPRAALAAPPGYGWAADGGQPLLRPLGQPEGTRPRPALRPPGNRPGWRWRRHVEFGWVLVPPDAIGPPPAAPPGRPRSQGIEAPAAPPPVASRLPDREPGLARRRSVGPLDLMGVVLVVVGLAIGAALLFGGGGGEPAAGPAAVPVPDEFADLAVLLGVESGDLFAALRAHDPAELTGGGAVDQRDPLARIAGSALVLVDLSDGEAADLARAAAGNPVSGQQFVVVLELGGAAPVPGTSYRFALLDAGGSAVGEAQPGDGDGTGRIDLRRAYYYEEPAGILRVRGGPGPAAESRSFALRRGRYVMIGVARDDLLGGTVFGQALAEPREAETAVYTLSPPYATG